MRNTKYVSATAVGNKLNDNNCVVVCFYGPKGGTRAIETLTIDHANQLAADLLKAVRELDKQIETQAEEAFFEEKLRREGR